MVNIEAVKNSDPDENLLCELIETDLMGVVIDECITVDQIVDIMNAVYLYKRSCGDRIKVFTVGDQYNTPYIHKVMEGYTVTNNFEFVSASANEKLLTRFLGSQVFITSNPKSKCTGLAKSFYLPRLCLFDMKDNKLENGVLYINSEPSSIGAALMMIKERNFSDELSGLKK